MLLRQFHRFTKGMAKGNCEVRLPATGSTRRMMKESSVTPGDSLNDEAPDLPDWVKNTNMKNPFVDEEFVIPSLANWIENRAPSREANRLTGEKPWDEIDKVSEVLNKRYSSLAEIIQALDSCSLKVSDDLVSRVLVRFRNDYASALGFFTWAKSQTGYVHSRELYDNMVDILGKSKKFNSMWDLVEEMNETRGLVTVNTIRIVLRRLAKAGRYTDAIDTFRGLEKFGLTKDTENLNILMDALVKSNSVEHASEAFLEFKNIIKFDARSFNILIHGYSKARKFEETWKKMEEMKDHGFKPDVVSYTVLVEAYCREKDFRRVDSILEEMEQNGCKPNVITYTIFMHALGKARQIDQVLGVYEKMKRSNCLPDSSFYGSLIFNLSKAGRLKDAIEIFEDMERQNISRDIEVYNTMISCFCNHSQLESALELLKRMEKDSCRPDNMTYSPLLKICCRKNRMKLLRTLLQHMVKNDVSIDLATYTGLVRGLSEAGKLKEACDFLEECVSKGMIPRESMFKTLAEKLEAKGMEEAKKSIQKLMPRAEA